MSQQPRLDRFYVMKTVLYKTDGKLYHVLENGPMEYSDAMTRASKLVRQTKEDGIHYSVIEQMGAP